jgi:hypothetical protein
MNVKLFNSHRFYREPINSVDQHNPGDKTFPRRAPWIVTDCS